MHTYVHQKTFTITFLAVLFLAAKLGRKKKKALNGQIMCDMFIQSTLYCNDEINHTFIQTWMDLTNSVWSAGRQTRKAHKLHDSIYIKSKDGPNCVRSQNK